MRHWYLKPLLVCFALFLTSCGGVLTWMAYQREPVAPHTAGQLELPGLSDSVEVVRDRWGIPHIFAQNESDLMRAMGYIHAQDRLFQMDILRRMTSGHLSEIVGDRPLSASISLGGHSTLEQDIGMRLLGFEHVAEIFAQVMDDETKAVFEAYAEGVNAYIAQNLNQLPVEFQLLNYEPEAWRPVDSIVLSRLISWGLATNAGLELLRAAADIVLGPGGAEKLVPRFGLRTPTILPDYQFGNRKPSHRFDPSPLEGLKKTQLTLETIYAMFSDFDVSNPDASNNWLVAGSRSISGKPVLANDPHLSHLAPSVFHLIHLAGADYDTIGASLPGVPFVIAGHNRHLAWAVTNCQADVQDLYLHKVDPHHPGRYLYRDTWEDFVIREEVVKVKEGSTFRPEHISIRTSRFGPVVTDLFSRNASKDVLSLRWTGMDVLGHPDAYWELEQAAGPAERKAVAEKYNHLDRGNDSIAIQKVNKGKSCDDFFAAMSHFGNPRQNWICGDDAGHIGYVSAGFVPIRNKGNGRRIARAWKDEGRWIGFIPFDELPQVRDPSSGYIVTANNQTVPDGSYPYPWTNFYMPGDRAARIEELLLKRKKVDGPYMSLIQGDRQSGLAKRFVPLFVQAAKADQALTDARLVLERWDGVAEPESSGAALLYMAIDHLVRVVLLDELGPDLLDVVCSFHHTYPSRMQIVLDKNSPFHDSVNSRQRETWEDSYRRALSGAYAELQRLYGADPYQWRWGDLHKVSWNHPLGGQPRLAEYLNIGPFPHGGGPDTVWAAFFSPGTAHFNANAGPAYRHVVDMARPEKSWLLIDTGNWGQPLTDHYDDLNEEWRHNRLVPGLLDRETIELNVEGVLLLTPVQLP